MHCHAARAEMTWAEMTWARTHSREGRPGAAVSRRSAHLPTKRAAAAASQATVGFMVFQLSGLVWLGPCKVGLARLKAERGSRARINVARLRATCNAHSHGW
jgi:hypothetical protein